MFYCKKCGGTSPFWKKYCPVCSRERTLEKRLSLTDNSIDENLNLNEENLDLSELEHLPSGFPIFDRIFDGGFLLTFVYYIWAARGAGKTSFLLQVCSYLESIGKKAVFFSFDESQKSIQKKYVKYGLEKHLSHFVFENNPGVIERTLSEFSPDFVVVDSLQSLVRYNNEMSVPTLDRLKKEAQQHKFVLVVIGEERKDGTDYLGSTSIAHIAEVPVQMVLGRDDEIIISTPKKNRDTDDKVSRCFFRRTPIGLVEISEADTGYLPRRKEKELVGLAAFVTKEGDEYFVDEMTVTFNSDVKKSTLNVNGMNHSKCNSLLLLLKKELIITTAGIFVRANRTEKPIDDSELACLMAILSRMLNKPIPVDAVFIGGVNNLGYLLPVGGMEKRVKRALALGYKRIIGPAALGSQNVNWEEFETLESVKKEFFQ